MPAWTSLRAKGSRPRARNSIGPIRPWGTAVAVALACATFGGCAPRGQQVLRVGINAQPAYEFAYLAHVQGRFAGEHLNVRLVRFESLSDSRRAFERGQLDGYFATVFEVLHAKANSPRSPRIVRVLDCSLGFDVVLARPGFPDLDSLRGRSVAVEPGSLNIYLLARALEKHDMDLGAVHLVGMDPGEMGNALKRGDVDAAVSYPPPSSAIVAAGWARPVFTSVEIPGEILDVLAFDESVLASRGHEVAAFLRAYDEAVSWMVGHREEACRIMAEPERITPAEFAGSIAGGLELVPASQQDAYFSPGGRLSRVVDATSRLMMTTGQIAHPIPAADVLAARGSR